MSVTHRLGFDKGEVYCNFRAVTHIFPHGATLPIGPGSPHCRGFTITRS